MPVRRPIWCIVSVPFVTPNFPTRPTTTPEQLKIRRSATTLDNAVLLVRLPRVLAFAGGEEVHLPSSRGQCPCALSPNTEQYNLGDVTKVEADAPTVRPPIFPYLVPDQVCLVLKPPGLQNLQPIRQERIGYPEVAMGNIVKMVCYGQRANLSQPHRLVARQPAMLGSHLPGSIEKPPRRISHDGSELSAFQARREIVASHSPSDPPPCCL